MSDLVRLNEIRTGTRIDPLDQLPAALVKPAGEFYAFFSDSLKGTTGIAFRLLWWMRPRSEGGEGLTVDDAITAMRRLMKPEKSGLAQYAGQVQAALAVEIEEVLKRRRGKEDLERIKRESGPVVYPVRKFTDGIGHGGKR